MPQFSAAERRFALIAACVVGSAASWMVTNIGAIASQVSSSYEVSLAAVGLLTTSLFIGLAAVQVPGGRACDRWGARQVALVGSVIMILGCAMALPAPDLILGLVSRLITGIGAGLAFIAGAAYVRSSGGSAFAQGLFGGIATAAGGVALAVVPPLEIEFGWQASYMSGLVISLIGLLVILVAPADTEHLERVGRRTAGVLRDGRLYRLAILFSASFGLSVILGNWVVEFLERNADASSTTAGAIGSLTLLLAVFSRPLGGWLLRRYPETIRLTVGISIIIGAVGTLLLLLAEPLWVSVIGSVLVGVGGGVSFAPAFTGAAVVRPDAPAGAIGLVNGSAAVTILVGTPLLGLAFSLPSDGRLGFAIIAALWLLALVFMPRTRSLGAEPVPSQAAVEEAGSDQPADRPVG